MERIKKKKIGTFLFLLVAVFLLYKKQGIDRLLSEMFTRAEGATYTNLTTEAEALGEILAGDVIYQPLYLDRGAMMIGVRIGTYIRHNDTDYAITVYDGDGNVLGKREGTASKIDDNQICYVPIYARIDPGQSYYLTVESSNAVPGNAVTCYGIDMEEGHNGLEWNGDSLEKELVTAVVYQEIYPFAFYILIFASFLFFCYFFWEEIRKVFGIAADVFFKNARLHKRKILLGCTLVGVFGILMFAFIPANKYVVMRDSIPNEDSIIAIGYKDKLTQEFTAKDSFDAIEVKLGTYMTTFTTGCIKFALYDGEDRLLVEKKVTADKIKDNQFLRIKTGRIKDGTYRMEFWTEGFQEQPLAFYYTVDGTKLIFHLLEAKKEHHVLGMFGMAVLVAISGIWYFCSVPGIRKIYKELLVVVLLSVAAGIITNTCVNYHGLSLPLIAKNLGLLDGGETIVLDWNEIENGRVREARYTADGKIYALNDQIYLEGLYMRIDSVTLHFAEEGNYPKKIALSVHLDVGEGSFGKADIATEYIYAGQESSSIPVGSIQKASRAVIGITHREQLSGSLGIDEEWYKIEKISINENVYRVQPFSLSFFVGFLFPWIAYLWWRFGMEGHLAALEEKKNIEVKAFVVAALVLGMATLLLLPAYQGPDEPYHVQHAFESIGAGQAFGEVNGHAVRATAGVMGNSGVRINQAAYREEMGNRLSEYPVSFRFHLSVLQYLGAALGTLLGLLLRLPVGGILFLGELLALFLYIVLGALAIKIAPIRKELFLVILLLPLAIHQASSYSYDSFNNVLSMLTVAYLLHLSLQKEKVRLGDVLKLACMLFALLYIKKIYVLLGILVVLIPRRKIPFINQLTEILNKKWKKAAAIVVLLSCIALGCVIAYMAVTKWLGLEENVQNFLAMMASPKELVVLLGRTVSIQIHSWPKYFSGGFGWLDSRIEDWITWLVVAELALAALVQRKKEENQRWKWTNYLVCLTVFTILAFFVIFSMFSWTQFLRPVMGGVRNCLVSYETIEGVQGRYFMPIIVLIFLFPISEKMKDYLSKMPLRLCLFYGWVIMAAYTVAVLWERYWI